MSPDILNWLAFTERIGALGIVALIVWKGPAWIDQLRARDQTLVEKLIGSFTAALNEANASFTKRNTELVAAVNEMAHASATSFAILVRTSDRMATELRMLREMLGLPQFSPKFHNPPPSTSSE